MTLTAEINIILDGPSLVIDDDDIRLDHDGLEPIQEIHKMSLLHSNG